MRRHVLGRVALAKRMYFLMKAVDSREASPSAASSWSVFKNTGVARRPVLLSTAPSSSKDPAVEFMLAPAECCRKTCLEMRRSLSGSFLSSTTKRRSKRESNESGSPMLCIGGRLGSYWP